MIQIAKKRSLWISQISLITSVKYDWFNQWNDIKQIRSVKINWFKSEKYCFHWKINEKANHWLNQRKFDWFRFREMVFQAAVNIFVWINGIYVTCARKIAVCNCSYIFIIISFFYILLHLLRFLSIFMNFLSNWKLNNIYRQLFPEKNHKPIS